jgi:hypothetical protein|tara:strand:- start:15393 stop:15677 length:285 start_codon:yes stop_codon:yes gene_type:complete
MNAATTGGDTQPLMAPGSPTRRGFSKFASPIWGNGIFLGLASAVLLGVATLTPDGVFSTVFLTDTSDLGCGATNWDCWKREGKKVSGLQNEVSN